MKIYINNLNLDIINNIAIKLKDYFLYSDKYLNIYTDEGIYMIDDKEILFLTAIDKKINIIENYYEKFTLIVDSSFYKKEKNTSINGKNILAFKVEKEIYKINKNSNLSIIIEHNKSDNDINDIYFELENNDDIEQLFIKKEIIEFLSMLN
jgi:hypothetical protein